MQVIIILDKLEINLNQNMVIMIANTYGALTVCQKHFTSIISLSHHNNSRRRYYYPSFIEAEAKI